MPNRGRLLDAWCAASKSVHVQEQAALGNATCGALAAGANGWEAPLAQDERDSMNDDWTKSYSIRREAHVNPCVLLLNRIHRELRK